MGLRNVLIKILSQLQLYDPLRDLYNRLRPGNGLRRAFFSNFLNPGDLYFDVGANIGEKVAIARSIGARVVAFEPHQACAKYLRRKFHGDNNVIVIDKALSSTEGMAEFFCCEANQLSTLSESWLQSLQESGRFGRIPANKKVLVATTTLNVMIEQYGVPGLLKIDVEGNEFEVLRCLLILIPFICFEFAIPENRKGLSLCLDHLDRLGYTQYNFSCDDMNYVLPQWVSSQELLGVLDQQNSKYSCGNVFVRT